MHTFPQAPGIRDSHWRPFDHGVRLRVGGPARFQPRSRRCYSRHGISVSAAGHAGMIKPSRPSRRPHVRSSNSRHGTRCGAVGVVPNSPARAFIADPLPKLVTRGCCRGQPHCPAGQTSSSVYTDVGRMGNGKDTGYRMPVSRLGSENPSAGIVHAEGKTVGCGEAIGIPTCKGTRFGPAFFFP